MRDPDRIPMILATVERRWRRHPDLRLGQLIVSLLRDNLQCAREEEGVQLFALADGELLRWIGAETDQEKHYIREEPMLAKEGWRSAITPIGQPTADQTRRRSVTPPHDADQPA
jgi:hypothetical protein